MNTKQYQIAAKELNEFIQFVKSYKSDNIKDWIYLELDRVFSEHAESNKVIEKWYEK